MLQKQRNKLTISILSRLKAKGPPEPQVPSFNPIGSESPMGPDEQEVDEHGPADDLEGDAESDMVQPQFNPPRKRKRRELPEV